MKAKEFIIKYARIAGLWLLVLAKSLFVYCLNNYLHEQLQGLIKEAVKGLTAIHDSEAYAVKKKEILDKIFNKVELPLLLRPFRWLIKNILYDKVEEKVQEALNKLNTLA